MVDFKGKNIRGQIETEAKLYEPATFEVLSFMSALELEPDPLSGQFVPITSITPVRADETQIFAVGIMPPSVGVTGRLVDRAASVRDGDATDANGNPIPLADIESINTSKDRVDRTPGRSATPVVGEPTSNSKAAHLTGDRKFWAGLVLMCNRLGVHAEDLAMVIKSESEFKADAGSRRGPDSAKGLIQITKDTALGRKNSDKPGMFGRRGDPVAEARFQNILNQSRLQQLPDIESYYRGRIKGKTAREIKILTFGSFGNDDGTIYSTHAAEKGFRNPAKQRQNYNSNKSHDLDGDGAIHEDELLVKFNKRSTLTQSHQAAINRARRDIGMQSPEPEPITADSESTDFAGDGAKNAQEHRRILAKTANTSLNQTGLGQAYGAAQAQQAAEMRTALENIASLKPLRLLVNPQSFRQSNEKIVTDNWGRNGPITEHWGDNQDKIEGSGKIAAFYSLDAKGDPTAGSSGSSPGLGRIARQFSTSYQNLLSLWLIYKNNGGVWFPDATDSNSHGRNNLSVIGSVYLYFDGILYIGSFDSFNLSEAEDQPFTLEYSFAFTVRAQFLLDNLENQAGTYGAPALFTPRRDETTPVQSSNVPTPVVGGSASPPGADAVNTPSAVPGADPLAGL